jgi:fatty-acyl-CoA synthase
LGVERGDAVAVISVNCAELLPLLLAAEATGIYAPINPALAAEHAAELVRLAGARVIVASGPELDPVVWEHARAVARETGARALLALGPTAPEGEPPALEPLGPTAVAYLAERMDGADASALPGPPPATSDVASYLHTGGTTGTPKLAARTHANEVANAWMIVSTDLMAPGSTVFAALPLFHTNALLVTVLGPLLKGQHVVWAGPLGYRDLPLYGSFWKLVERHGIMSMSGVPTVYAAVAQVPVDADISSLQLPIVGAAPLPPAVSEAFQARTGVRLCEGYGLTEGTCASARSWPDAPRAGTLGQRLPYQEVRAVAIDEATGDWTFLEAGELGTIVLRGPNIFAGYLVRGESGTELHADGKLRDGWLDTGDLGAVDDEGFIRLAGRAKDLIIRGGHNIDPATIEDALLEHPAVAAAGAVGRPDVHAGEVPIAFVALTPGVTVEAAELEAWAADHVPERAAAPRHVEIIQEIPLTAVGKPYKPELRRRETPSPAPPCTTGYARSSPTGRWRSSSHTRPRTRPCARPSPPTRGPGGSSVQTDGRVKIDKLVQVATPARDRHARRREQTRAKLVEAARTLFARHGVDNTRINEITDEADVGFGSFYNHFDRKEAIVEAVLADTIAAQGEAIQAVTRQLEDPAEVVAAAHRHFVRRARSDPDWGWLLIRMDVSHNVMLAALGSFARRDLRRGIKAGRLHVSNEQVALVAAGGALLAVMRAVLDGRAPKDADIHHAEGVLRLFGLTPEDAARVARRPLPASDL